jgi:hypothetical protein
MSDGTIIIRRNLAPICESRSALLRLRSGGQQARRLLVTVLVVTGIAVATSFCGGGNEPAELPDGMTTFVIERPNSADERVLVALSSFELGLPLPITWSPPYEEKPPRKVTLAEARVLLDVSGVAHFPLLVYGSSESGSEAAVEILTKAWEKGLGIDVEHVKGKTRAPNTLVGIGWAQEFSKP